VKKLFVVCPALLLIILNTPSFADLTSPTLVFKMTADKTTLLPDETTTMHVWAWVYDPLGIEKPDNGIDAWQLDLSVDNTGVISIVSLDILTPDRDHGFPSYRESSLNNPFTGEVREVGAARQNPLGPSLVGVGVDNDIDNPANYYEMCNFTIKASSSPLASSAAYTISNDGGGGWFGILTDGTELDSDSPIAYGDTYFYADGSDNVITIVPEPGTLVLLGSMAVVALHRRRKT